MDWRAYFVVYRWQTSSTLCPVIWYNLQTEFNTLRDKLNELTAAFSPAGRQLTLTVNHNVSSLWQLPVRPTLKRLPVSRARRGGGGVRKRRMEAATDTPCSEHEANCAATRATDAPLLSASSEWSDPGSVDVDAHRLLDLQLPSTGPPTVRDLMLLRLSACVAPGFC